MCNMGATGLAGTSLPKVMQTSTSAGGPLSGDLATLQTLIEQLLEALRTADVRTGAAAIGDGAPALGGEKPKQEPVDPPASKTDAAPESAKSTPEQTEPTKSYTVKSGDTLANIAQQYGVNWRDLYASNKATIGSNPNMIYPGQVLQISGKGPVQQTTTGTATAVADTPEQGGAETAPASVVEEEAPAVGAEAAPEAPATTEEPAPEAAPKIADPTWNQLNENLARLRAGGEQLEAAVAAAEQTYEETKFLDDKHAIARAKQAVIDNNNRIENVEESIAAYVKDPEKYAY